MSRLGRLSLGVLRLWP